MQLEWKHSASDADPAAKWEEVKDHAVALYMTFGKNTYLQLTMMETYLILIEQVNLLLQGERSGDLYNNLKLLIDASLAEEWVPTIGLTIQDAFIIELTKIKKAKDKAVE